MMLSPAAATAAGPSCSRSGSAAAIAGTITCRRSSGSVPGGSAACAARPAASASGRACHRGGRGGEAPGPQPLRDLLEAAVHGQVSDGAAAVPELPSGDLGDRRLNHDVGHAGLTAGSLLPGRLGVAQSEIGFPFLFHEVPYVRANVALAGAGAFGPLRLSGWCRAVTADVAAAVSVVPGAPGLRHYNLSISTSDQMIARKFTWPARPRGHHRRDDRRGRGHPGGRRGGRPLTDDELRLIAGYPQQLALLYPGLLS